MKKCGSFQSHCWLTWCTILAVLVLASCGTNEDDAPDTPVGCGLVDAKLAEKIIGDTNLHSYGSGIIPAKQRTLRDTRSFMTCTVEDAGSTSRIEVRATDDHGNDADSDKSSIRDDMDDTASNCQPVETDDDIDAIGVTCSVTNAVRLRSFWDDQRYIYIAYNPIQKSTDHDRDATFRIAQNVHTNIEKYDRERTRR